MSDWSYPMVVNQQWLLYAPHYNEQSVIDNPANAMSNKQVPMYYVRNTDR